MSHVLMHREDEAPRCCYLSIVRCNTDEASHYSSNEPGQSKAAVQPCTPGIAVTFASKKKTASVTLHSNHEIGQIRHLKGSSNARCAPGGSRHKGSAGL